MSLTIGERLTNVQALWKHYEPYLTADINAENRPTENRPTENRTTVIKYAILRSFGDTYYVIGKDIYEQFGCNWIDSAENDFNAIKEAFESVKGKVLHIFGPVYLDNKIPTLAVEPILGPAPTIDEIINTLKVANNAWHKECTAKLQNSNAQDSERYNVLVKFWSAYVFIIAELEIIMIEHYGSPNSEVLKDVHVIESQLIQVDPISDPEVYGDSNQENVHVESMVEADQKVSIAENLMAKIKENENLMEENKPIILKLIYKVATDSIFRIAELLDVNVRSVIPPPEWSLSAQDAVF